MYILANLNKLQLKSQPCRMVGFLYLNGPCIKKILDV